MADIVGRLRAGCGIDVTEAMYEAANEIDRLRAMSENDILRRRRDEGEIWELRAEIERLRAALEEIASGDIVICEPLQRMARAALTTPQEKP